MVMAAAKTMVRVPLRAPETVSHAAGRQTWLRSLPLRSDNNASQLFTSLRFLSRTQNSTPCRLMSSFSFFQGPFQSFHQVFVSGLSFGTTEESLRNAFKNFGQLLEVNLVMDKISNRPKGFVFIRYATEKDLREPLRECTGSFWMAG